MGRHDVASLEGSEGRAFTRALLRDLTALEEMIRADVIERGIRRIGAEQEVFLVGRGHRPALIAMELLDGLDPSVFTTELARFNLEINAPPFTLEAGCLDALHGELTWRLNELRARAESHEGAVALVGILPTITRGDLTEESITPLDRYRVLAAALTDQTALGSIHIRGVDELRLERDSPTFEACNTSFQVHLQVDPDDFAPMYNAAQVALGPLLAGAVNSPLLLGRRLWAETRIALFAQTMTGRLSKLPVRGYAPRVSFGSRWVERSVLEVFEEDVARYPTILGTTEMPEDPMKVLARGEIPELRAFQTFNSTVYRWNRPCYGSAGEAPHLRIECRVLPSGPTVVDEVANAAFWIGLTLGLRSEVPDLTSRIAFNDAKDNFVAAARRGLKAGLTWFDGERIAADRLILDRLLELAASGLSSAGLSESEISRYLGVLERRVASGMTGAAWATRSLRAMGDRGTRAERMAALTAAAVEYQTEDLPVAGWSLATLDRDDWRESYRTAGQCMSTDLFTVNAADAVDLPSYLMERNHVRQVPVEDADHLLLGVVDYMAVLRLEREGAGRDEAPVPVTEIMDPDPLTVAPATPVRELVRLLRERDAQSVLVVDDGRLVGIVGLADLLPVVEHALDGL